MEPNLSNVAARLQLPIAHYRAYDSSVVQFDDLSCGAFNQSGAAREEAWELSYIGQREEEFQALKAFYDDRMGAYRKFYWNHPMTGEVDIPVRFDWEVESFSWKWDGPLERSVLLRIRRVK